MVASKCSESWSETVRKTNRVGRRVRSSVRQFTVGGSSEVIQSYSLEYDPMV